MVDANNTLKQLQVAYVEAFSSSQIRNRVGVILEVLPHGQVDFVQAYFEEGKRDNLDEYYHLALLGMSHQEILCREKACFNALYERMLHGLLEDATHWSPEDTLISKVLLYLNVEEANRMGQPFDFDLWRQSTIINIQPIRAPYFLSTDHSIGNKMVVHMEDAALLGNMTFKEKQKFFLDCADDKLAQSAQFIHTLRLFHEYQDWNEVSVVENKVNIVRQFRSDFKKLYEELNRRKRGRYKC